MRWWSGLLAVGPWLGLVFALPATGQSERPESAEEVRVHEACSGCHAFPPPESLPRHTWRSVVADMAVLILEGVGAPPDQPPPPPDFDLERLAHYFESRAPRALPSPAPWPAAPQSPWPFEHETLGGDREGRPAAVANVRLLRLAPEARHRVVATDMLSGEVLAADPLKPSEGFAVLGHASNPVHAEAVDLDRDGHLDLLVSDLGDPAPSDHLEGAVVLLRGRGDGGYDPLTLASGLPRVADTRAGDFDGDGDLDLVVAAFGWRRVGSIMLLENRTTDWRRPDFAHRVLDGRSGAIHVPVMDLDGDGKLDFVALLSQHHEAVIAFLGDGTGGFRQEVVDRAPHPAWGSSGLQIADLDGDGDLDALVTNGDMLDDFQLKPYHGVRWLENRGGFPFVPHAIAPMFCVMRAQAADLDGDGDMDIVATALVKYKQPGDDMPRSTPEIPSLVWLEQTSPGRFERHTIEGGLQHLSLDLGDYDGDGDIDIVVANSLSGSTAPVDLWENRGPSGSAGSESRESAGRAAGDSTLTRSPR